MATQPRHADPEALRAVVAELAEADRRVLLAIAYRRGLRSDDAEEAVNEAFVQLLRFYDGPAHRGEVRAYLISCLYTVIQKRWRTHRRRERPLARGRAVLQDADVGEVRSSRLDPGPVELVIARERVAAESEVLAQLPEDWRAVLLLRASGYEPAEVGRLLRLTDRQVRKRIEKANRRLRELEREFDGMRPIDHTRRFVSGP